MSLKIVSVRILTSFKMCNVKKLLIFFYILISIKATKLNKDNFENIFGNFFEKVEEKAIETSSNTQTTNLSTFNYTVCQKISHL
jgi:hypothetical protein